MTPRRPAAQLPTRATDHSVTMRLGRSSWRLPRREPHHLSPSGLRGYLDLPATDVLPRQPQMFQGWALDGSRPVSRVELTFNRSTTLEADLGAHRPDVPEVLGEPEASVACGWSAWVDLARWPEGNLEVSVTVSGRSGPPVELGTRSFRLEAVDLPAQVAELRGTASAHQRTLDVLQHQLNATIETVFAISLPSQLDVQVLAEPPHLAATSSFAAISFNYRIFRSLSWQAERRSRVGDYAGALTVARVAAEWAWFNHPGLLNYPILDRVVAEVGRRLVARRAERPQVPEGKRRRVAHVVTQAYPVGGHTRLRGAMDALRQGKHPRSRPHRAG